MRSLVCAVQEHYGRHARGLQSVLVTVAEEPGPCPVCGGRMGVQKTVSRSGRTLAHGSFEAHETIHYCLGGCRWPSGSVVTKRAACLSENLPPRQRVGYDVISFVGLQRFVHYRQRDEIRDALLANYGLIISTGELSALQGRFVMYLQRLHVARRNVICQAFASDGGWPLHIDATGEEGRGTLLIAYAGWRRWVVGAWKIPTEHTEAILPCLQQTEECFGPPVAVVRDLGRAMTRAVRLFTEKLGGDVPVLACHQHFLADVGNDLLDSAHGKLRALFRRFKVRPALAKLARDLGRKLGADIKRAREGVCDWQTATDARHTVPSGDAGFAVVRALAQWILDYAADGDDLGMPFDRPYLALFDRCTKVRRSLKEFLRRPPYDPRVHKALRRLRDILQPVAAEIPFLQVARTLRRRAALFDELRCALRLVEKPAGRNQPTTVPASRISSERTLKELRDIRTAIEELTKDLQERRTQQKHAGDQREAINVILKHIDEHGPALWGHVVTLPENAGGGFRVVERTNCRLESLNGDIKRGERRRSGRKRLTQDLEHLPAGAALALNLTDSAYVKLLCGSLKHLGAAFAALDEHDRLQDRDGHPTHPPPALFASPTPVETASLPKRDRHIVRADAMVQRIQAAANSRAPRNATRRPA